SRRAKAFSAIATIARDPISFLAPSCPDYEERYSWFRSALGFYSSSSSRDTGYRTGGFVADETARLNLARALACSGVQRGDMAPDLATWRRLDIAATAFNEAVKSRLQQRDLTP